MTREEFKKEWLTDAFYFITCKEEFIMIQTIGISFGILNHMGNASLITYDIHDVLPHMYDRGENVAENITFFPKGFYQQSAFWIRDASYGDPKSIPLMLNQFEQLEDEQ